MSLVVVHKLLIHITVCNFSFVLGLATLCLMAPVVYENSQATIYMAFVSFETCVGIFWPAMGFMRGIYLPEQTRTTIMNFCRVPLNTIVVVILLQNLQRRTIFQCCVFFLSCATVVQHCFYKYAIANLACFRLCKLAI